MVAFSGDLLAASGLQGGDAGRHVLALEGGSGHNVTEEHGGQSLLVGQQTVQSLGGNLVKGGVGGREHGEGSLAGQGLYEVGGLDGGQEGGELRGGDNKLGNVACGSGCLLESNIFAMKY